LKGVTDRKVQERECSALKDKASDPLIVIEGGEKRNAGAGYIRTGVNERGTQRSRGLGEAMREAHCSNGQN